MNNNELTTKREISLEEIRSNRERFPRLKDIPEEEANRQLQPILLKAFMSRGQNISEEALAFMASALRDELMRDEEGLGLQNITIEEIRREVRAASLGSRGEIYGISVASIYRVLAAYAAGAGTRAEANLRKARKAEQVEAEDKGPIDALFLRYVGTIKKAIN